MLLDQIPADESSFIDSNIFIYHFTGVSDQCTKFLMRCEQGELNGVTSVTVLLEVLHRLMMIEVVKKNILNSPNLVRKLQEKPEIAKQLDDYFVNTQKILEMGVDIKSLTYEIIMNSHQYRKKYGLLVNDSIIMATIMTNNIKNLASNDQGFLRIDDINIYRPTDIIL